MLPLFGMAVAWTMPVAAADTLNIGWAEADVTPPLTKRVPLDGQYYQRLADTKEKARTRTKDEKRFQYVAVPYESMLDFLNRLKYAGLSVGGY